MSKKDKGRSPKKRKRIATIQAISIPNQLRKARNYPIKECFITEGWQEKGMCSIFVLREKPDYHIIMGIYLVDLMCLGLKDTFYNIDISYEEVTDRLYNHPSERFVPIYSDLAHSIIYGGIDYAKNLGFVPHGDFRYTRFILEPQEEIESDDSVEFGKNGKPHFFAGPYDSKSKINKIISQLEERLGEGNFHYTYPIALDDLEIESLE
jgi:hypothetical protein